MRLNIIQQVFDDLDLNNVRYCHWKSNEHLEAALEANTDLDVLFDISQQKLTEDILIKNNFHLFEAPWYRKYDGIVDYIGFDQNSGKIVHIHTHFKLMIGEVGVKSFHLPWEQNILDNVIIDKDNDFKAASPEIEYLLLVVRTTLKFQKFNNSSNKNIAEHFEIEAQWLDERVNLKEVMDLSIKYLNEDISKLINEVINKPSFNIKSFALLRRKLRVFLSNQRRLSKTKVLSLQIAHFALKVKYKLLRIAGLKMNVNKRRLPKDGLVITLMGPDGAGKSTQTKAITKELKKKVNVLFIYLGSGDGQKSLQRRVILKFAALGKYLFFKDKKEVKVVPEPEVGKTIGTDNNSLSSNPIKLATDIALHLSVAREKKKRLKVVKKAREKGIIVICDRYPQIKIFNYNDGPKLQRLKSSKSFLMRKLAAYEYNCYALANTISPDLVVKLLGDTSVLFERRPEMSIEEITKKQNGIKETRYGQNTNHVDIDIEQSVTAIKGEILSEISNLINKKKISNENFKSE